VLEYQTMKTFGAWWYRVPHICNLDKK